MRADARKTRRWFGGAHRLWSRTESFACSACIFLHLRLSLPSATCRNGGGPWMRSIRSRCSTDTMTPCSIWLNTGRAARDFLVRSDDGHLDLPRAREGGLIGG